MKTIFILLDHGLAHAYFFETELAKKLADSGLRLVFLVPGGMQDLLRNKYPGVNIFFESMRDAEIAEYRQAHWEGLQELYEYVRRVGMSSRGPLSYVETARRRKEWEARGRRKFVLVLLRPFIQLMRHSKIVRKIYRWFFQSLFSPALYRDLFEKYQPELVVSNMAGWRMDQYLLREANQRRVETAVVIVGWDNPSSQGLTGADIDHFNVWSEIQKHELVNSADIDPQNIHIGGMPLFDSYINRKWVIPRDEYFRMHGLDLDKKLIAFAATGLNFSPNSHMIMALAELVGNEHLGQPAQLLIRLHPNHFKNVPRYKREAETIYELKKRLPHIHIVEPREMPGDLERYAGEDYPEKASMMAHCDVLVTLYSTMVVEVALQDKPIINACLPTEEGYGQDFWVPILEVPTFPTSTRVNATGAGRLVKNKKELEDALSEYLLDPTIDSNHRHQFLLQELTYLDGSATSHTARFLLDLVNKPDQTPSEEKI
ncbi:MAG TPA: CDP-glycerol glycerophosphotransferase family protein [Anaerolineales bacterium]|nr:CDP-glycerol glycerophosphotransferase family protein [Anaerolineales bacterium]